MIVVRKKTLIAAFSLLTILVISGMLVARQTFVPVFNEVIEQNENRGIIVIDAGHGGEDGGAVASDGTVESGVNLAIAKKVSGLCDFLGVEHVMVRSDDRSLAGDGADTLHQKKVDDLKKRVLLANSYPGALLLSIHQNSLPESKSVHGAQVFYNHIDGSGDIAASVQDALNKTVNINNNKSTKQISNTIYLMKNVTCEAVLVECGFLSNSEETKLLCSSDYQNKLAVAILSGVLAVR